MEPLKEYGGTELSLDNCIVPNERLLNTPSSKDGCSHELEVDLRIVGCEYIQSAGLLLRLPQVAMATAQVLFQRFYYSKSFIKYSIQPLAMASIFLAAKIEENFRRLREVINVFHHLKLKRMGRLPSDIRQLHGSPDSVATQSVFWPIVPMEYMGEEYFKTKSTVIKYERFLLKELGFCVHVKHPHKLVVTYLQMLDLHQDQASLVQRAWNNMNDSLRTNVFVRFTIETIACACVFLAARQLKVSLPLRPPWWQVFGAKQKDLEAISLEILALYTRPKKLLDTLEKEVSVLREKLAKKQVEIKEVNVKKITSSASPETSSPLPGEQTRQPEDKASSKSPLAVSSLQAPKTTSANPSPLTQSQSSKEPLPIKNGNKRSPEEKPCKRSRSPAPEKDHKSVSDRSRSRTKSPVNQLISSPIKLSSSESEQDLPSSMSPSFNGIPERYRRDLEQGRDLEQERHHRKRHKHRSEKHHSKHSRSKYKSHDNDRRKDQQYYDRKEEYDRSREVYGSSKNYRKRDKDYEREYYSSSKIRKTEPIRYR